ncbi:hypothetical protein DIPPA_00620 [Diplonema papillatum]|nr:hypothetical protein DIPPA_00620 [Diplonema papillatum]
MWHVPWAPGVPVAALLVSILTTAGTIIVWRNVHWYGGAVSALQADLALLFSTVLPFATTWLGVFHSAAFAKWWKFREALQTIIVSQKEYACKIVTIFDKAHTSGSPSGRNEVEATIALSLRCALAVAKDFKSRDAYMAWLRKDEKVKDLLLRNGPLSKLLQTLPEGNYGFLEVSCLLQRAVYTYIDLPEHVHKMSTAVMYASANTTETSRERFVTAAEQLTMLVHQTMPAVYQRLTSFVVLLALSLLPFVHIRHATPIFPAVFTFVASFCFYAPYLYAKTVFCHPFREMAGLDVFSVDHHLQQTTVTLGNLFARIPFEAKEFKKLD